MSGLEQPELADSTTGPPAFNLRAGGSLGCAMQGICGSHISRGFQEVGVLWSLSGPLPQQGCSGAAGSAARCPPPLRAAGKFVLFVSESADLDRQLALRVELARGVQPSSHLEQQVEREGMGGAAGTASGQGEDGGTAAGLLAPAALLVPCLHRERTRPDRPRV